MSNLKWWVIAGYYGFILIVSVSFNIYLKRKAGEGIFGGHIEIPKNLLWIFILGMIRSAIMLFYPIIFLIYPDIIDITFPVSFFRSIPFEITGTILILAGCIIMASSLFQLGLSTRFILPRQKTELITKGVYAFCRNPIYVGVYLSFIGIFFLLPSLIYLIGFSLFLINQHFRIMQEEKFLIESFGSEYENYCQRVGRYWPKIGGRS